MKFDYEHRGLLKWRRVGQKWKVEFKDEHEMWMFLTVDRILRDFADSPRTFPPIAERIKLSYEIREVNWQDRIVITETVQDPMADMC